jgi:hypothetical protein
MVRLATALCALVVAMAVAAGVVLVATDNSSIPPYLTYSQTPPTKQIFREAGMARLPKNMVVGFVQMTYGEAHARYPGLATSSAGNPNRQVYVLTAHYPPGFYEEPPGYSVLVSVASGRIIASCKFCTVVPRPGYLIGKVRL